MTMEHSWQPIQRPAAIAESRLIEAIVCGHFPINSTLPGERQLARQIGVTRPTLRETLQRLARDGWLDIQHGKPTRVRDYWQEGRLGVLAALAEQSDHTPPDFVPNLLAVRALLAPAYVRQAVLREAAAVASLLIELEPIPDTARAFANADWRLHRQLSILSGNPIFTLVLNSFAEMYQKVGHIYYSMPQTRRNSRRFHAALQAAAADNDPGQAEAVMRQAMEGSREVWGTTLEALS
jgi:GntR family negative regulator for fad regulon and positive regulator of fabA